MNFDYLDGFLTGNYYPSFVSGSCYVMTKLAAECLLQKSFNHLFFHLEDVFLTGFVAEDCQIPRINHPGKYRIFP